MGAVQKIVSIGMDKALTLSRPKINAPAKSPSSRPAFISPAAIRQREDCGLLPVPQFQRSGRLQKLDGAPNFSFHSIVHGKSSRSSFESVFLAARSRDLMVGSGVFVIRAISFAVNWWK